jgi:hypothetical protein
MLHDFEIFQKPKVSIMTNPKNGPIEVHTYMMQYIAPMGPYTGSGQPTAPLVSHASLFLFLVENSSKGHRVF